MARAGGKDRGIFFRARPAGEVVGPRGRRGEWWTRWCDADGKEHREKAGTKSLALDLYRRRKTEVRQGIKFPETLRRRDVRLKDLVDAYLESVHASQAKTTDRIRGRLAEVLAILGDVPANAVKAEDLERLKLKLVTGTRAARRKPATVNRFLQDLGRSSLRPSSLEAWNATLSWGWTCCRKTTSGLAS